MEMKQFDHIEFLINESAKRDRKVSKIQALYEEYIIEYSDCVFTELIQILDEYCTPWVRKHLWGSGCYTDENEHTVLQAARMAVWESTLKGANQSEIKESFAYYAFGIYKKKTLDVIRKISRRRAKIEFTSIDEPMGDGGKSIIDVLPPMQPDFGEKEEVRRVYEGVFRIYCSSFMNSKTFPPRCLALYYARVLPHLLDEIPDSKATSAKWAFARMGKQSVWVLTQDSEKTLQNDIDENLTWGPEFIRQLNDEINISGKIWQLKDIIYTSVYDKGKIEDWADYMHKATIKASSKLLLDDKDLLELVKEYIATDSLLRRFWGQKEGNSR